MMFPLDGIRLAAAKLRTRPVRTGIVITIVALLFAGIATVAFVVTGISQSLKGFSQEGLSNRFIVQARPIMVSNMFGMDGDKEFTDLLRSETVRITNEKKVAAKRLGITYDPTIDATLPTMPGGPKGGEQYYVNAMSSFANAAIAEKLRAVQHVDYKDFAAVAKRAGAKQTYKSTYYSMYDGPNTNLLNSYIQPITDGKEAVKSSSGSGFSNPSGFDTLTTLGWATFDSELLLPFVLSGQNLAVGKDGSIPVIAPMSVAEEVLSMTPLTATSSSSQRLERLVAVRKDIAGKTAQLCYRNTASAELMQLAHDQAREIAANKGKRGYQPPALQYTVPTEACGAVVIAKDTRSAEEKQQAANELTFKKQFESYQDPAQSIVTTRIVGLVPDQSYEFGFSVRSLATSVLQSSLGVGWFSPVSAIGPDSIAANFVTAYDTALPTARAYYAEFGTLAEARSFVKAQTCSAGANSMMPPGQDSSRVNTCYAAGKYFDMKPFGSNAAAVEDLRQSVWKVMKYVTIVVVVLATLVLMGIVGKIIADSRRETAVFRALGATRNDIRQVYLTYTVFLGVGITLIALCFGAIISLWLSSKYSQDISTAAVLAYNAADVSRKFALFGLDGLLVIGLAGIIIASALFSALLPLATNLGRNPIRDMRDEN